MPVFVHFEASGRSHIMELTTRDIEIEEGNLHSFYQRVFRGGTFLRTDLISITRGFLEFLETIRHLIEFDYRFRVEGGPFAKNTDRPTTGGWSGFKVNGQSAGVTASPAKCEIRTMKLLPNGTGETDRCIDLRPLETFQTDEGCTIYVSKRKAKLRWFDELPLVLDFLDESDSTDVKTKVVWGRPNALQLIRRLAIRDDPGGGCGEELYQMGDEGRIRLLELLSNLRHRKYHTTIAEFLHTMYPSDTTREAIKQAIERSSDENIKVELVRILGKMTL